SAGRRSEGLMRQCSRVLWVAACALGCGSQATWAQDLEGVVAGMRICASEGNDASRLACYDRQFRHGTVAQADPKAGSPPTSPRPAAHTPEQRFGLSPQLERAQQGAPAQPPQLARLTGRVTAVSYKLRGQAVMTLENGQVWEQADADSRADLQAGDSVTI